MSGQRAVASEPWLFGKGTGVPPAERKRLAEEERFAKRRAAAQAEAEARAADVRPSAAVTDVDGYREAAE